MTLVWERAVLSVNCACLSWALVNFCLSIYLSSVILLFVKICLSVFPFDVWDGFGF